MSERGRRLFVVQVLVLSLVVTLFGRLWYLQVVAGSSNAAAATSNVSREVVTTAARGLILDDLGRPLVRNRSSLVITVDRAVVRGLSTRKQAALFDQLADVVGVPADQLVKATTPCGHDTPKPCWAGSPFQPVPVKADATPGQVLRVKEHAEDFPGVQASFQTVREYPQGSLAAAALGYLGAVNPDQLATNPALRPSDQVGQTGLEAEYDAALRGRDGIERLAVDNGGRVTRVLGTTPAVPGGNLVLSLDAGIQAVAEKALADGIARVRTVTDTSGDPASNPFYGQKYKADSGAVVVVEAKTGRVVALANSPSYDPSLFVGGISGADLASLTNEASGYPLVPRAWQGQYAPGSIFKPISTAGAIAAGANLYGTYDCPGFFKPDTFAKNARGFANFESEALGPISLERALIQSCDTVYYKLAYDEWLADGENVPPPGVQPQEAMITMARAFGLGSPTGIDLPGEQNGRIVDRAYKQRRWEQRRDSYCENARTGYPDEPDPTRAAYLTAIAQENCTDGYFYRAGDAINFAIGQGETVVTPLQMAMVYAAIANGGTLYAPTVAKAVLGPDGQVVSSIAPSVVRRVPVAPATLAYMKRALAQVTSDPRGTGRAAYAGFPLDRLPVAGKTGTAQVASKQDSSWFASYAPANDPQYVVVAMVSQAGQGGRVAAPITRAVYEGIYGLGGTPGVQPCNGQQVGLPRVAANLSVTPPCPLPPGTAGVNEPGAGDAAAAGTAAGAAVAAAPAAYVPPPTGRFRVVGPSVVPVLDRQRLVSSGLGPPVGARRLASGAGR